MKKETIALILEHLGNLITFAALGAVGWLALFL